MTWDDFVRPPMQDERSTEEAPLWIAVTSKGVGADGVMAMIVQADDEESAAEIAADWFTEHPDYADALPITHLFIAPWLPRAYEISCKAALAELQCCGGGEHASHVGLGGHWASCPNARPVTPTTVGRDDATVE